MRLGKILAAGLVFIMISCRTTTVIEPSEASIVLCKPADPIKKLAAKELRKHIEIKTGEKLPITQETTKAPGKYQFLIGQEPPGDIPPLKEEEARIEVRGNNIYIYGDDNIYGLDPDKKWMQNKGTRTGTLFAVYLLLEKEFGFRWACPGDRGIMCTPSSTLRIQSNSLSWIPAIKMRWIRPFNWDIVSSEEKNSSCPSEFIVSPEKAAVKNEEEKLWAKKMREGNSLKIRYGHAFTSWWKQYGKEHPEYFALTEKKQREPVYPHQPDRVKMCVSNPALQQKIVDNWLTTNTSIPINLCENDGSPGFCRCPDCMSWDCRKEGEKLTDHLTDRYIRFASEVLKKARNVKPDAKAVIYVYSFYYKPPRREKVPDGLILGMVPRDLIPTDEFNAYIRSWKDAGAKEFFYRPNDLYVDIGMPLGFEKLLYDNMKLAADMGSIGFDYDSDRGLWTTSGMAVYILSRTMNDTSKPFEHWENDYCAAYGPAAPEVKKYFAYWRRNFEQNISPNICESHEGNLKNLLFKRIGDFFSEKDFDITDKLLEKAGQNKLSEDERALLEQLVLSNKHSRLMLHAFSPAPAETRKAAYEKLMKFRTENMKKLDVPWPLYFNNEKNINQL